MKAEQLLDIIGSAKDCYVADALEARAAKPRLRLSRLGLIAAILAMAVLLTGCVAVVLHLQDKKVAESTYTKQRDVYGNLVEPTELTSDVIYPYAPKESPMLLAAQEWYNYRFAPDMPEAWEMVQDESLPEHYKFIYHCVNREMADKLDEIVEKYDLKLLTKELVAQAYQKDILYEALGIQSVVRADARAEVDEHYGELSPCGTFSSTVFFTLEEGWDREAMADFYYAASGYFSPYYVHFSQEDVQWTYQTADGTTVLMAMQPDGQGTVFADVPGGSIAVHITPDILPENPYPRSDSELPTKEVLEQMADLFDYHIGPQPFDPGLVEEKLAAREAEQQEKMRQKPEYEGFGAYLDTLNYLENWSYILCDLNGDGVEDMILHGGFGSTGLLYKDGVVTEMFMHGGTAYPCENGYIMVDNGNDWLLYYKLLPTPRDYDGSHLELTECLSRTKGVWEHGVGENTFYTPISDEQAQAVKDKYPLLDTPELPCLEFPMNGTTLGQIIEAEGEPTGAEIRQIYADFVTDEEHWWWRIAQISSMSFYDIRDVTGDGRPELLLGKTPDTMSCICTLYRRRVLVLRSDEIVRLRENHVVEKISSKTTAPKEITGVPNGEMTIHSFSQFQPDGHSTELADCHYIKDTDSWINYEEQPIPASDYQELIDKYPLVELTLRPIEELLG